MRRFLLIIAILWACTLPVWALEERGTPATVEAKELNFDRAANMAYGTGNVLVQYKGATLHADKLRFNSLTHEAWAEGHVRVNRDGQEWTAPAAYYNFETRQFKADEVRGFFDPIYIHGVNLDQAGTNQYAAVRATATTCDLEQPHYRVQATRAEIYPGQKVVLRNCTVFLGQVPVFWIPVVAWSLDADMQPPRISLGHSSRHGYYLLTTTYWRLAPGLQLAVDLDERTERGFAPGLGLNYKFGESLRGAVRGYYIRDSDPLDSTDEAIGKSLPTHRYLGQWRHKQFFSEKLSLTADVQRQSDTDVVADFFHNEFQGNSEPTAVVDLTQRGENFTVSLLAQPQLNSFFAEVQRLPEASWMVNRVPIGPTPLFYEGGNRLGYYQNDDGKTGDSVFRGQSIRLDTFHQVVMPETLFGWLSIVPRAGGRYTYYQSAPATAVETQEVRRVMANLGSEVSFKLSRTWNNVAHKRLGVDGLRHIIQPFADYSWTPPPNVRSNELFQFDTDRRSLLANGELLPVTRYVPVGFSGNNIVDSLDRENLVRFGLRQKLQTRRNGLPWDLVELTGWTDYQVDRQAGQRNFSDLFGTVEVRPTTWFGLNAFTRYDTDAGLVRELNTEARVADIDRWSVGVGTRYLRDDSNLIAGSVSYRLLRQWVAQVYQRFDMHDGTWEEQDYVLRQELHDWYIHYGVRHKNQRIGRDETAIYFSVTLKAYPGAQLGVGGIGIGGN